MFVAKCPLRISLLGGSTDQEAFLRKFDHGSVISFPSNLYAYVSIHDNNCGKYIINYSKSEKVSDPNKIKNDVVRVCLEHFNTVGPVTITFNTNILSTGSGLASSSAYTIAMIKALSLYTGKPMTEFDACDLAIELERKFNPLTGYQDSYGCGVGGFKRMDFRLGCRPTFTFFGSEFINSNFTMALYNTGIARSSTGVLSTLDFDKSFLMLEQVDRLQKAIQEKDRETFIEIFRSGWKTKKETSPVILDNPDLQALDSLFETDKDVLGAKLCGAGAGGYFLVLYNKGEKPPIMIGRQPIPIHISDSGVTGVEV